MQALKNSMFLQNWVWDKGSWDNFCITTWCGQASGQPEVQCMEGDAEYYQIQWVQLCMSYYCVLNLSAVYMANFTLHVKHNFNYINILKKSNFATSEFLLLSPISDFFAQIFGKCIYLINNSKMQNIILYSV